MSRRVTRIQVCTLVILLAAPFLRAAPVAAPASSAPPAAAQTVFDAAEDVYRSGEWEKALKAFQDFETKFPYSGARPMAQYYQGWCYFNLKKYPDAIKTLNKLLQTYKEAPIIPEATIKLAECHREQKEFNTALQIYQDFQKNNPSSPFLPQAMIGEAWVRFKNNDIAGAKTIIYAVLDKFRQNPQATLDATFLLGQMLNFEKKFDEARAVFHQIAAQSNNPRATEALFSQAETFYEGKNYEDAIRYFKRVQSNAALLANISAQMDQLLAQRAEQIRAGGDIGLLQTQIEQLRTLANQIQQREDLRAVSLFRIANCYQELKCPEEASIVYRTIVEKYPNHKTIEYALFGLIQSLTESKRLDEASAITEQFRKQFPKSVMLDSAGYMQAISVFSTGDFKDALQRFEKFLPTCKTPDMTESTEFYIAACHYGLENFSKANELFAAFTKKYPNSQLIPDVLFRLGRTNFELSQRAKKPEEIKKLINAAVGFYEQVRSRFPKYEGLAEIVFQLGYLYNYYGTHNEPAAYDKAVGAFTSFLDNWGNKTAPDGRLLAPEAWYQIARAHLAAKRYAKAIEAYQTLVQKFPDNDLAPYAAVEAGSAYYDLKKPADGLKALRAYVQKYPDHVKVGDVLFAIGSQIEADQPDEAIQTFQDLINRTAKADEKNREAWLNPAIEAQRHIVTLREKAGNIKAAVADSEAFLASFSNEPVAVREIFARMTALYRKAKLSAEGYAMFEKLAKQYSQITSFRIAAATSLIELALGDRDYARATAAALKLLQDPEKDRLPAITYLALGNAFLKTEKFDFARDAFQKTLKLYPNDTNAAPLAQLGLGQALLALKDFNGAETAFNKQMPANLAQAAPEALLGLARIYEERGRDKNPKEPINVKAVQYYNIAAQSGRRDIANEAYYRLGNFFFHIKESDPAKNQENKKTALPYFMRLFFAGEPFAEEGAFRAGQCHETLGNHEAALLAYQTYARRYPKGKFKAEADQKIADLTVKTKPAS